MTNAPLFFDVVSQQREDQHGKDVLHSIVGIGGVALLQRHAEILDTEDEAAINVLALQEREQISVDFGLALRELLIFAEQVRVAGEEVHGELEKESADA